MMMFKRLTMVLILLGISQVFYAQKAMADRQEITAVKTLAAGPSSAARSDELALSYRTIRETAGTFTGQLMIANPNPQYVWNGSHFTVQNLQFETTARISTIITAGGGSVEFSKNGNIISFELGWQSFFPLGKSLQITIEGTKSAKHKLPGHFKANYVRGKTIRYSEYGYLPDRWQKNKPVLYPEDLIVDRRRYYDPIVNPVKEKSIILQPNNATQIQIGQVAKMNNPVNGTAQVRIWIPCKLMAMGIGFTYEFFKMNPNYLAALGTKEHWAAGIIPPNIGPGVEIRINGTVWHWPTATHAAGPYQQAMNNFNDLSKHFADFFPPNASYEHLVGITIHNNHPQTVDTRWVSSTIAAGISVTHTREIFHTIKANYEEFITQSSDRWAELAALTYSYNQGIDLFIDKAILTTHRQRALSAGNLISEFGIQGSSMHVPTVKAITRAMNTSLNDIYDARINWSDMETFFNELRKFYGRNVPREPEWTAMKGDVHKTFTVLAAHWPGSKDYISYRYDFLTLLRILKQYLPAPYMPRPVSENWYYQIEGLNKKIAAQGGVVTNMPPAAEAVPQEFELAQNYPNPFNPTTTIEYRLASPARITIAVYNTLGEEIAGLVNGVFQSGLYQTIWNGKDQSGRPVAGGIYFYRMTARRLSDESRQRVQTRKLLLLK